MFTPTESLSVPVLGRRDSLQWETHFGARAAGSQAQTFTYATSRFKGNKNLPAGCVGSAAGRDGLWHNASAYGFKVDYPNDPWDIQLTAKLASDPIEFNGERNIGRLARGRFMQTLVGSRRA